MFTKIGKTCGYKITNDKKIQNDSNKTNKEEKTEEILFSKMRKKKNLKFNKYPTGMMNKIIKL